MGTQAYAAVYDPASQSVKLVYWRQYLEYYLAKDLEARKPKSLPEQTIIYDPKTQGLRLQLWSDYEKENKPAWTQAYAAIYDTETKSVKLIYWKDYLENYLPYDIKAREAMEKKMTQKVVPKKAPPRVWNPSGSKAPVAPPPVRKITSLR